MRGRVRTVLGEKVGSTRPRMRYTPFEILPMFSSEFALLQKAVTQSILTPGKFDAQIKIRLRAPFKRTGAVSTESPKNAQKFKKIRNSKIRLCTSTANVIT